jgi:receptor-interacting serine/threonine-protein kinase 5
MKQLMHGVLLRTPSSLDDAWKRRVASNVLSSLTETRCQRLAKSICAQIKDRVRRSHVIFETSLQRLEVHHNGRLQQTEKQRLHVRKEYAPRIARLALESRSLRDLVLYGKPLLGPEVGRGQYGVVYSCESWAGFGPCAVKSVAPPDDRHWNDLALEFHYTTNIPEHHRIVSLRGSIIDYTYGSGSSRNPAVLLIMDRFKCDLYAAIEQHMNWLSRLQVAVDVVEGIRYLHAQGLVHRDIKLKNVLLDTDNRGRLTDLGFCKPEAMMSGSIVGTPLHMAPELVTGKYDHSVDVYAFGVLFWYICAGTVRLPTHFEVCTNKDMLFTLVRKGLRPERPPDCDRDCWELMNRCWDGEPVRRPHVGELELSLRSIYDRVVAHNASLSAAAAGTTDQQTGASHVGTTPDDLIEVELVESLTTDDSELDFDDLTLQ